MDVAWCSIAILSAQTLNYWWWCERDTRTNNACMRITWCTIIVLKV
jgi:hypothetical protein